MKMKNMTLKLNILIHCALVFAFANTFAASGTEQAKKFISLAGTYREAGELDKAKEYIDKAQLSLKKSKDKYWLAKSHEQMGYLYRDMSNANKEYSNKKYFLEMSLQSMNTALNLLKSDKKNFKESKVALESITKTITELNNKIRTIDFDRSKSTIYKNEYAASFDNSKFKKFPEGLQSSLKYLSLAKNGFNRFPSEILDFHRLEYLDISENKLKELPNDLTDLPNLKVLRLKGNKIKTLPENLAELKNLKILDISNNSLKSIPNSLMTMTNLDILDLRGNKLKFEEVKKVLQNLPKTQILHDDYILKQKEAETGGTEEEVIEE